MTSGNNKFEIKMKKIVIYTSLLAAITLSCSKLENEPIQKGQEPDTDVVMITEKISGGRKVSSKATIDNDNASIFKWSVGDAVAVHVSNGDDHKYVTSSGADVAEPSASFTVTYEEGYTRDAFAIYPASIVAESASNYGQSGSSLDVTLPASYTLGQVTDANGEKSPCPMIASNTGTRWDFYQLCGLLRLTVNSIPANTKRLVIIFDGKKVCGDFSIASSVTPGTSVIATSADADHDWITITNGGENFGTSEILNLPLPTGNYSNIYVVAYDAISGGKPLKGGNVLFNYSATNTKGVKRTVSLSSDPQSIFSFTFNDGTSDLSNNLRFVRLFSCKNKLYNGSTTYGPYTVSNNANMDNPVEATLKFDSNNEDQLAFQVVTEDGKVYSGLYNAPSGGFIMGKNYNLTVTVKDYKFTTGSSKQVYFSPGDLGVDSGEYSFTEPFETWGWKNFSATKRVWFNYGEISSGLNIFGIDWRNLNTLANGGNSPLPQEWDNIIVRTNMKSGVNPYYRVTVSGHANCLLLPPDETQASDIEEDLTSGTVTDYAKYFGKGFVLLISTGRATYGNTSSTRKWEKDTEGWYWALWHKMGTNRTYFSWGTSNTPAVSWAGNQFRMRVRYVHDVE